MGGTWRWATAAAFALALRSGVSAGSDEPGALAELPRFVRGESMTVPPVAFDKWKGTGYGAYLLPKDLDVGPDGGVDVVIHLNGAMMADKDWRDSGLNAIVASVAITQVVGSAGYARLFASPGYLDHIVRSTFADMKRAGEKRALRLRRLALVSWSAGMGGVSQLLSDPKTAERIDSVVLLDSIHTHYQDPKTGQDYVPVPGKVVMGMGVEFANVKSIGKYVRFGQLALRGEKTFIVSCSNIKPPDYASCSETAEALARELRVAKLPATDENALGMKLKYRADKSEFHVRGFAGGGPHDHFDQLHVVGDLVRTYLAPRWNKLAAKEREERRAGL